MAGIKVTDFIEEYFWPLACGRKYPWPEINVTVFKGESISFAPSWPELAVSTLASILLEAIDAALPRTRPFRGPDPLGCFRVMDDSPKGPLLDVRSEHSAQCLPEFALSFDPAPCFADHLFDIRNRNDTLHGFG